MSPVLGARRYSLAGTSTPLTKSAVHVLPKEARDILINASHTDLRDRAMEIDRATARVKILYPQFFQQE